MATPPATDNALLDIRDDADDTGSHGDVA
ncbi:hypothetical protein A2U01_0057037, partial [Trifolium medium]|nr:hypothetical protein [Trifolium medium]